MHRARGDSGQNEAERTNASIGDALVTGETLNWEHYKRFKNMCEEDIEALTLQERMEKNAWKAAGELAERVDGEAAPHGFISCSVTPHEYEQFYWDKEVPMLPPKGSLQRRSYQVMATIQKLTVSSQATVKERIYT